LYKIPANTLFLAKKLIFVPECHSTNTLALDFSQQQDFPDGTVVITNHQTAGRGQRGNVWEAEAGKNLTLSILLKTSFLQIKHQFFLNIFTSLAVHDLIFDLTGKPASIKWPNDILVNGKKLCGILIENQLRGSIVSCSIVGIGLNVNQINYDFTTATSLRAGSEMDFDLNEVFEKLMMNIESRYLQLKQNKMEPLKEEYLNKLYWRNETREFSSAGKNFKGNILGIDDSGRLSVDTEEGLKVFDIKEITYVQ
jgi:BirA family biotin operon repressor/biotin-[acetyl-CoA-carboxylase] ligase